MLERIEMQLCSEYKTLMYRMTDLEHIMHIQCAM